MELRELLAFGFSELARSFLTLGIPLLVVSVIAGVVQAVISVSDNAVSFSLKLAALLGGLYFAGGGLFEGIVSLF